MALHSRRPWLVYGTGNVAAGALRLLANRGVPVIVAGRNSGRVRGVAEPLGLRKYTSDVSDINLLQSEVCGVLNLAGPYRDTARPLMGACLNAGVHYVDVSNEAETHLAAWDLNAEAQRNNVNIVAGAGVGTWFTERLVDALAATLEHPISALVASAPSAPRAKSPGVEASQDVVLMTRPVVLAYGEIRTVRRQVSRLPRWMGVGSSVLVGTGDVIALAKSSRLSSVTAIASVNAPPGPLKLVLPFAVAKARWSRSQRASTRRAVQSARTPSTSILQARIHAEVTDANGKRVRGRLLAGSGTAVASHAAVAAIMSLEKEAKWGTRTAHQVLGRRQLGAGLDPLIEIINYD